MLFRHRRRGIFRCPSHASFSSSSSLVPRPSPSSTPPRAPRTTPVADGVTEEAVEHSHLFWRGDILIEERRVRAREDCRRESPPGVVVEDDANDDGGDAGEKGVMVAIGAITGRRRGLFGEKGRRWGSNGNVLGVVANRQDRRFSGADVTGRGGEGPHRLNCERGGRLFRIEITRTRTTDDRQRCNNHPH